MSPAAIPSSFTMPDSVASPQDLSALVFEVRDYARWYEHEFVKQKTGAKKQTPQPELSAIASDVIRGWAAAEPLSQTSLDHLITILESYGKTAPVMTITLAAPAPVKLRSDLTAWARANLAPNILISFRFNSTILGGMVVRYGSRIYDWSFRRQIMNNISSFPEVLHRV